MSYDEKTGTIITDGDRKQFERDLYKHFETVAKDIADKSNANPDEVEYYKKLQAANTAIENAEYLKALSAIAAVAKRRPTPPNFSPMSMLDRLRHPSKNTRLIIIGAASWTIYVIYRTLGDHELLGIDLDAWDDGAFFSNWLMVPAIFFGFLCALKWAMSERKADSKPLPNRVKDFEVLIKSWPADQARRGLLLLKAALSGSVEDMDRIAQHMTLGQVKAVCQVLSTIEENELVEKA